MVVLTGIEWVRYQFNLIQFMLSCCVQFKLFSSGRKDLLSRSKLVQIYFRWRPAFPNPDDDRILEVAVRVPSMVITFNTKDFAGAEQFGIRIIRPQEMLTLVGGQK